MKIKNFHLPVCVLYGNHRPGICKQPCRNEVKMFKYRLYFNKAAMIEWLNEMSVKGWAMTHFFAGLYTFEECQPGKYVYQVDFGEKMFSVKDEYKELIHDTGAEIVQCWGYWIILRKLAASGAFELYTDTGSKIEYYIKIRRMFKIVTIIELVCIWWNLMAGIAGKNLYGFAFAFLLAVFAIALGNGAIWATNIINRLREAQSGIKIEKRRKVSVLLAAGLFFNSFAWIIQENVSRSILHFIQMAAVALLLAGIWDISKKRNV